MQWGDGYVPRGLKLIEQVKDACRFVGITPFDFYGSGVDGVLEYRGIEVEEYRGIEVEFRPSMAVDGEGNVWLVIVLSRRAQDL